MNEVNASQIADALPVGHRQHDIRPVANRHRLDRAFVIFCIATASLSLVILVVLLLAILVQGAPGLSWTFLTSPPSADASRAGIRPALFGSIWLCAVCGLFTLPIGVATAIFLEEFKPRHRLMRMFHGFVQLNIANLAGVPSVVYGIIGLTAFVAMFSICGTTNRPEWEVGVKYFDQFLTEGDQILMVPVSQGDALSTQVTEGTTAMTLRGDRVKINVIGSRDALPKDTSVRAVTLRSDAEAGRISRRSWYHLRFPFGRSVVAGGLTLMLVVLPIVIIASQEALRAVPDSLREGAMGMGATPWQIVWNVTLPSSVPGIMTGAILSMSRAIGEAAPILIICGIVYIASNPSNLMDNFTVMPLQIYNWASRPQAEFHGIAATGIVVLLTVLLSFNAVAVLIRQKMRKPLS